MVWDITVEELNSMVDQIEQAAGISVGSNYLFKGLVCTIIYFLDMLLLKYIN